MSAAFPIQGFGLLSEWNGDLSSPTTAAAMSAIKATGANSVELTPVIAIRSPTSNAVFADPNTSESDSSLAISIQHAHALGLSVVLKPAIIGLDDSSSMDLAPTNPATFFASYTAQIVHLAQIAQQQGVETFAIGNEMSSLSGTPYLPYWTALIAAVRQVYGGSLTYAAAGDEASRVSFWSQLDTVGVNMYPPLSDATTPTVTDLVKGWTTTPVNDYWADAFNGLSPLAFLKALGSAYGKPVLLTEVGFRSIDGTAADPGDWTQSGAENDQAQANAYQAFAQVFSGETSGWLKGVEFWQWDTSNVFSATSYSPMGKPAQTVVTQFFNTPVSATKDLTVADYNLEGPRWGTGALGTYGGVVTWAIDNTVPSMFAAVISAAFADWSAHGNITFQQSSDPSAAEITFSDAYIDGVDNTLGNTGYSYVGTQMTSANVTFDSGERWTAAGPRIVSANGVDLFSVALHEVGHALGLDHYNAAPAVMNAYSSPSVTNLTTSDLDAIKALYGVATWTVGTVQDLDGSGTTDLLWQNQTTGAVWDWGTQNGQQASNLYLGGLSTAGWQLLATGDFNGDHTSDLLWQNRQTGAVWDWGMQNGHQVSNVYVGGLPPADWKFVGTGDLNGDQTTDLLWQNATTGAVWDWGMQNGHQATNLYVGGLPTSDWNLVATGDFNGDRTTDLLWQNKASGAVWDWGMSNGQQVTNQYVGGISPSQWSLIGTGDFDGNKTTDLLWQNTQTGAVWDWGMADGHQITNQYLGALPPAQWGLVATGDYNGDKTTDLLWQNKQTGAVWDWGMQNGQQATNVYVGALPTSNWHALATPTLTSA